jgi:hypothetical protein
MKTIYKIFFFFFAIILIGCPNRDSIDRITFKNNSNKDVYFYIKIGNPYKTIDTVISIYKENLIILTENEYYVFNYEHTFDTLRLFFFDIDTINKYPWEQIQQDYNILKRYDISRNDLKKIGYYAIYPPTETMKDLKMYPPYEE